MQAKHHLLGLTIWIALLPALAHAAADGSTDRAERSIVTTGPAERGLEPVYRVQAGIDGDVYPAFANYASLQEAGRRTWGVVAVTISNPSHSPLRRRLSVQITGWSDQEMQLTDLAPGGTKTFLFAPTFLPRLFRNREITPATAAVSSSDLSGKVDYATTIRVRLHAAEDMFWGTDFKYAAFIASWVTPHDEGVSAVLRAAKEFMPSRRLPGYETWKSQAQQEKSTYLQARAIYRALQNQGISYVKSSLTFGNDSGWSERVRLPHESLKQNSANCIDGVVMFASVFENLGMQPVVVLVPGHAYVAVRLAPNSESYLLLDTVLLGHASFESAVSTAEHGMARYATAEVKRISISQSRSSGIYPMP